MTEQPMHDGLFTFMDCPDRKLTPTGKVCFCDHSSWQYYWCDSIRQLRECPRGYA